MPQCTEEEAESQSGDPSLEPGHHGASSLSCRRPKEVSHFLFLQAKFGFIQLTKLRLSSVLNRWKMEFTGICFTSLLKDTYSSPSSVPCSIVFMSLTFEKSLGCLS